MLLFPRCTLALVAAFALAGCREPPPLAVSNEPVKDRGPYLKAFGDCALDAARAFHRKAQALQAATAALSTSPTPEAKEQSQLAFRSALEVWQTAEAMRFGPAASRSHPGGQELREHIYSWPLVSRCAVEEQIVSRAYAAPEFTSALVNRRGLAALEYLLFYPGDDTGCPAKSSVVSSGGWAALSLAERAQRKREYAAVAAQDLVARAAALVQAWEPGRGGFLHTLETAGPGNPVFPSAQSALNAVSDGLFQIEAEVKDMKLARPLGLRDCESTTCPESLESQFAGLSKANIRANLEGFRRIAEGCEAGYAGQGFDDLLESADAPAAAQRLRERTAEALARLELIEEGDLREALTNDRESVRRLYDAVKELTDLMKTELVTVLDLELPMSLEGDND